MLVGGLRPLEHDIQPHTTVLAVARMRERGFVHRRRRTLLEDGLQVISETFGVLKDVLLVFRFVFERDPHALVQIAGDLQPLLDRLGIELDLREDRRVWAEENGRPGAARGANLLQGAGGVSLLEAHLPLRSVAAHGGDQLFRQRVHDAGADAVQAAGRLVVAVFELAAGVQRGEDDLDRALFRLGVLVDRDSTPVVGNRDGGAVLVERDGDVRGKAVHRLVDGVVEHFPDEVVEPGGADPTDVHARALANGLEPFENGDVFCCVGGHSGIG